MTGLLLINLGTPDLPTTRSVRRYLRQFLSDPRVIDINPIGRFLLLNLFILPFRPAKSASAYRQIWTERGSPLLFHSQDLVEKVQKQLGSAWTVELGMRYGAPSISDALDRLMQANVDRIVVLPLFPHYASSSGGSALEATFAYAQKQWNVPVLDTVAPFYIDPSFIEAFVSVGKPVLEQSGAQHILFSFHGLPERHIRKSDPTHNHCLQQDSCCEQITSKNRNCYRAQCFATARALAEQLELPASSWTVCFQSRLGRTPWIRPYTDQVICQLAEKGIQSVAVFCPAFVADCLETIEEIGIRAKQQFISCGGKSLTLVPSLNSSPRWVEAVCALATNQIQSHSQRNVR